MSSFHVDSRINLKLEYELAIRLGEMILRAGTEDKQILALGHKLANMDEDKQEFEPKWQANPSHQHGQFSGWDRHDNKHVAERFEGVDKPAQSIPVATMQGKIRSRKIRWGIE
jgi:hypothetical protein